MRLPEQGESFFHDNPRVFHLNEEGRENVTFMKVDVTKPDEVKRMINSTIEKYGRLDVLIVNAGVVRVGPVEDFPDSDYDLLIDVNLKGTHYTCKFAVPQFKKQKTGSKGSGIGE